MNAVDLFSGVGGLSLGFKRAGFRVLAAFDNEPRHIKMYSHNFPGTVVTKADVTSLTAERIFSLAGAPPAIDLVFGGPPCQGFSSAGKRDVSDERNQLLGEFVRLVCELRPKVFVAENVAGILTAKYAPTVRSFYDQMSEAGYRLTESPLVLDANRFGVPQRRKRVFFIGVRDIRSDIRLTSLRSVVQFEEVTVRDAIGDLPLATMIEGHTDGHRYYGPFGSITPYSDLLRNRNEPFPIRPEMAAYPGIGGCELTNHTPETKLRFAATVPGTYESISRFFRLAWDGIAPTLRAGTPASHGQHMAARPIHPDEPRCITVREAARLHSFPDWFEFYPTKWYGFMGIGNSVPPFLAHAVAEGIKAYF